MTNHLDSSCSIGFLLLTHANEDQALRLAKTLTAVFGDPPIVCHHDFSQTYIETSRFPSNVRFVRPHLNTRWGKISLVNAMLSALRELYESAAPDWFYLISGSDYPIKTRHAIERDLRNNAYDVYMRLKKVDHREIPKCVSVDTGGFDSASYARLAYQRYIGRSLPIPSWRHPHRGPAAMHVHLLNPKVLSLFHPFDENYFCYSGDQWFAANSRAAKVLLSPDTERVVKYFRDRFPPDEAVCPTILGNAGGLKISTESKHFIRWEQGHHPRLLDVGDMPEVMNSNAHFARKFAEGAPALDRLDAHLGVEQADKVGLRA